MGVHTHSIVFMRTKWGFRGCSQPLKSIQMHSQAFRGFQYSLKVVQLVRMCTGPMDMFSNTWSTLRPYKFALNFHWVPILWLRWTRRVRNHDVTLKYMTGRRSRCLPMRLATKNKKVLCVEVWSLLYLFYSTHSLKNTYWGLWCVAPPW